MGWQDAPEIPTAQPGWQSAPEVSSASPKLSPMQDIMASTDWAGLRKLGYALAPSIAPTAGAVALTPFLGPWAGPVAGGVAGEAVNNLFGVTEPSAMGYATQALVPPALRGAANVGRLWPKFGTEKRAAKSLNEIGIDDLRLMQKEYQPLTPSQQLFARVGNEPIAMPETKQAAKKVLDRITSQLPSDQKLYAQSGDSATDLVNLGTGLPVDKFQQGMSTMGQRVRAARRGEEKVGGSTNVTNYSQLYGGYAKDLEAAPMLKDARQAYKREQTLEDMGELARPFIKKGVGETEQVSVNKLMTRLKDETDEMGRFFHQSFNADEQKDILSRLGKLNDLPGIGAGPGQRTGSSHVNPVLAGMLGLGSAGYAHGGAGEAMGAAAGAYALSGTARMTRDLAIAWNIPAGRALIGQLLDRSGGKLTPEVWAGIQAFAGAQTANLPQTIEMIKREK